MMREDVLKALSNINMASYQDLLPNRYLHKGLKVPRATEILAYIGNNDYLLSWANAMGFKRQKYGLIRKEATEKGTIVHSSIENFIQNNEDLDLKDIPANYRVHVNNCFSAFKEWWNIITNGNTVEVVAEEIMMACPYFGGTIDLILKINDKLVMMDFKTSNHDNYKYFLQLGAYSYLWEYNGKPPVDVFLVLRLDKEGAYFEEVYADVSCNREKKIFMDNCTDTFLTAALLYLQGIKIENDYKSISRI